ncbi:Ryncolin-2,Angiopoietin-related protein 1,Ryncolin-1,Angiopoietin-1,Fibrinogen C domain-containing protein 1,Fibroleukin,Fibrinogen-like protein 1,Ficolin-2,Fibrinogen-like protein A,Ryncolin-3,Angiopoietin-related protein 2 [Mytilus edulis]|uniref:Fibrinogen C-terminal domain-containing protein n=1 Tax=Mytilus edulis TaxID=6550 RepID=A0A8S3SX68_MYTED|nr:Ryncolin-2,Angiopoietin-related protein 1,Ryncolin-1,Angiopoietin-1,Fibrinogen C domain-containing protein 1,Fibroleukin,Fibrinogen-like protein 1,Ficolin-2,Fibrinogen-like protein A,Ryncolin-3,Angiopoietin-related protein 2 [Mytilus edulis]
MPIIGKKRSAIKSQIRSSACNRCCSDDLCNMDCWKSNLSTTTTTGTTESTTTKTTVKATTSPATTAKTATTSMETTTKTGNPRECSDINFYKQGVFTIYPRGDNHPKRVYCMRLNGVKWTVIQRRINGSTNFDKTWNEYKEGFGNVNAEYWFGNEYIHAVTTNGLHKVHFILELSNGTVRYADYSIVHIGDESTKYSLNVTGYSGNAGDCLDSDGIHGRTNGMNFTTKDQDNDRYVFGNCAVDSEGGWWFSHCEYCDLNGKYGPNWDRYLYNRVKNLL